ncbi:nucleoside triphosphate pyrophosphohydrolase [Aliidiomarina halalkaliphila]|uniref:Nucleoside triphosphate pyrophosphohydrolase n=2 Tax=Aliidiomarina halalkaliphila TaxID=2593535 RepID=A0A552X668_9GAMM|nr:nucleoside triphosphate pyrophosphohydrolase [Aliidiomarina halalkaliphila]
MPQMQRLLDIMRDLRDPDHGCPWDCEQTMESLIPYTLEEAYEVADAISKGDMGAIQDELGDLLFQVVFYAQLGQEQEAFAFDDVAQAISDKLVRRHPHVFAQETVSNSAEVLRNWEQIKRQERSGTHKQPSSLLDGIPENLPALMQASKIQKRCATVGFDWKEAEPVLAKINEEVEEVREELNRDVRDQSAVEEEIGDLLFAVVNLARHCDVNAESALRKANLKFANRFKNMEKLAQKQGISVENTPLDSLENLWETVKSTEKAKIL